LASFNYTVDLIDVSSVVLEHCDRYLPPEADGSGPAQPVPASDVPDPQVTTTEAKRIRDLQLRGNLLRKKYGTDIIAKLCVSEVILPHITENDVLTGKKRQAYIIDSLKHPHEVQFLRDIFRESLWMVGVVASDSVRKERLHQRKSISLNEFEHL